MRLSPENPKIWRQPPQGSLERHQTHAAEAVSPHFCTSAFRHRRSLLTEAARWDPAPALPLLNVITIPPPLAWRE